MNNQTPSPHLLRTMDSDWRVANCLSDGQLRNQAHVPFPIRSEA